MWSIILLAQNEFTCLTTFSDSLRSNCAYNSPEWSYYRNQNLYVPDGNPGIPFHNAPIKTVNVSINVVQKDDETGNFLDTPDTRNRFRRIIDWINDFYSNYSPSDKINWVSELPNYDSKIRFSIGEEGDERIYFIKNTSWWYYYNAVHGLYIYNDTLFTNHPERMENVNIFIFGNPNNYNTSTSLPPFWNDFDSNTAIATCYWPSEDSDYAKAGALAHELGHVLDLLHTYSGYGSNPIDDPNNMDFLKDVFLVSLNPDVSNCPHIVDYYTNAYAVNGDRITNNLMGGNKDQKYISPLQAGQMHRALSLTSSRKYAHCEKSDVPLVITDEQLWDFDIKLYRDLIVESGAKLTLTNHLVMNPDCKIIVKPGGKLIVDGAMIGIDIYEKEQWPGIEVWGNSSTHQHDINGSFGQGYIELKNGAVIENAKCAVELWHPGIYSTTGGIIHATDATFRNNAKAVHALWYSNMDGGREGDYNGYFRNCSFIVDDDYIGTKAFHKHVDLAHVKGLDFWGCNFSAKRSVDSVSLYCMGIGAYEAGFRVDSYCTNANTMPCPGEDLIPSSFNGFYRGIHASNDGSSARAFSVRNAEFTNNTCGIFMLNTGYGTIVNNEFVVGCGSSCDFGIYADGVSGFCIEDNTFRPKATNMGSPYGIMVVNSRGTNDVYHNEFNNLRCGNVAVGVNTITTITPDTSPAGLTYTCNTNTGNLIDFCVLKDGNVGDIAQQQGSAALPAGNTFGGSLYHFYNGGAQWIGYHYDSNGSGQIPSNSLLHRVSTHGTQNSNSCLSHYGGGGSVSKTATEKAALALDYHSARSIYESLLQVYESRIDGGNTPAQVADINSATPSGMWELRAQLLGISPYVSGEVLTTAAERYDVFSDPVLFEILAANPDELKKDSLISYLENKEHPLPAYMTDLLRQIASGFTARTALQAQMEQYRHAYSLAAGDIVRSCLHDSVADLTELRTWLANTDDLASDRMLVASYLHEGDSVHAFALANMLPELYSLQGDALADHSDYMRLIGLYQTLNRESCTIFELTDTESAMVDGIASSGTGTSKAMAEAILMERSDEIIVSHSCPTMPEDDGGDRGRGGFTETSLNEAMGFTVSVSPNPATTWTMVAYTLPVDAAKATFNLTNALGVTVATYDLPGDETQKVIDLRGLADGFYLYTVQCGKHVYTGKLVVTK